MREFEIENVSTILVCPNCEKEFEATDTKDASDEICPYCSYNYMNQEFSDFNEEFDGSW